MKQAVTMLRSPFEGHLRDLFRRAEDDVMVISPFVTQYGLAVLHESLEDSAQGRHLAIMTNISANTVQHGALDLKSLATFCGSQEGCQVRNLPGLHAKIYVADETTAIVTSANLTRGGQTANYEYGTLIRDTASVGRIRADMLDYAALGVEVTCSDLTRLSDMAEGLRDAAAGAEREVRRSAPWRKFSREVDDLKDELLRQRVRHKSINSIFADTVRYLLRLKPMTTPELEMHVQAVHPDMCDDTIDRVIDGVRFGKKWKHMVRNTQQFLKKRGEIVLRDGRWCMASKSN